MDTDAPKEKRKVKMRPSLPFVLVVLGVAVYAGAEGGALEDYVKHAEARFAWQKVEEAHTDGFRITHLTLTSQQWREYVWPHHLRVVRPETVRNADIAFLFITGDGAGTRTLGLLQTLAARAGAMAAVVTHVPNQPLYDGRKEDALIAYTFDQYRKTRDATWPLLFPMVKSAVQAMDAVQAFAHQEYGQTIDRFVTGGASKRGWTAWLVGAVDPRVQAIAPMAIDLLNMRAQVQWADKVYGKQSEKIRAYTDVGLLARMDEPAMVRLREWVDPYAYRQRYTMPKLLLTGTNDPYWTVDAMRHYVSDLPGVKLIFQTPNAGHDLGGSQDATQTLAAFFQMIADREDLPHMAWDITAGPPAQLSVHLNRAATALRLWTADSPDRDFRNAHWTSRALSMPSGSNRASAEVAAPASGYRAFLAEVTLTAKTGHVYKLSTEARVTPDTIN
jgi:PhoPQ-activated pathogenicity-related protein